MSNLDMTKAYKDEIRILKKAKRKVMADWRVVNLKSERAIRAARREADLAAKRTNAEFRRIDKRMAILEARLSSN
jgi:hypothetical protein